ncbi:MAG: ion transporter [Bacteroidota bacterium]
MEAKKSVESKSFNEQLRFKVHEIIFEADTPAGKGFDVALLVLIVLSVVVVMLESVESIAHAFGTFFLYLEWIVTVLFTLEYVLRIYAIKKPWNYIFSFYGIVDLLSILPTYLSLVVAGSHFLVTIRALRLLRIFRILKLGNYLRQSEILVLALRASRTKITVFLFAVLTIVIIVGSTMYLVEGGEGSKFSSIPRSIYWAIVTLTTVGYGDISPTTDFGQFLAAIVMILGYAIIAVPTGIVSVELAKTEAKEVDINTICCPNCGKYGHTSDAVYCKHCGHEL